MGRVGSSSVCKQPFIEGGDVGEREWRSRRPMRGVEVVNRPAARDEREQAVAAARPRESIGPKLAHDRGPGWMMADYPGWKPEISLGWTFDEIVAANGRR